MRALPLLLLLGIATAQPACGDCNGDGQVAITDALEAARLALGLVSPPPADQVRCDADADADVDILDALALAQQSVGLPVVLRCGLLWEEQHPAPSPEGMVRHRLVFDESLGVTLLFGGLGSGYSSATWLWDGLAWVQAAPAQSPPGRSDHGLVYEPSRSVALLFGGYAGVIRGDTWTWDGLDWTELSPPAPPGPRYGHAMAHDPARGVTVLFAGADAETWEWDGMLWQQRFPPSSPTFRFNHGLAHDPVRQVTVLFGGDLGLGNKTDETWEWNGSTWTEVLPAVRPAARSLHAMVHHPGRGTVLLFGGQTSSPLLQTLGDTWEWDGAAWRPITPLVSPPPRSKHAMTYDPVRQVVVLFGGEVGGIRVADTWEAP